MEFLVKCFRLYVRLIIYAGVIGIALGLIGGVMGIVAEATG